jgi:hypothetical protein
VAPASAGARPRSRVKYGWPHQARAFCGLAVLVMSVLATGYIGAVEEPQVNRPPSIVVLRARQDTVEMEGSCPVECVALDEDGDELAYDWSASGGDLDFSGASAVWRAPKQRGTYSVGVRVSDGNGGESSEATAVTVTGNSPPVIASLTARVEWLTPSNCCRIDCDAEDADGDDLSYEWLMEGGRVFGVGPVVMWMAPETIGLHYIAVEVTDGYGGRDGDALAIRVLSPEPPSIEDLQLAFEHPEYVKKFPWGYRILKGELCACRLECTAVARGKELSYQWSCDGGEITGSGPVVTWTPPDAKVEGSVGVTVRDVMGNAASRAIFFRTGEMWAYTEPSDDSGGCGCG